MLTLSVGMLSNLIPPLDRTEISPVSLSMLKRSLVLPSTIEYRRTDDASASVAATKRAVDVNKLLENKNKKFLCVFLDSFFCAVNNEKCFERNM
jgi:hypothetical protein